MNRKEKTNLVQDLNEKFSLNNAAFVISYEGMSVAQMQSLRLGLAAKDSVIKVAKNRLVKLALNQNPECLGIGAKLRGQTALVFAKSDLTGVAKILYDFSKKNEELKIIAACCEKELFDDVAVKRLAMIPSRDVLLAQLCGVLQAPLAQFLWILQQLSMKSANDQDTNLPKKEEN